MKNVFFLLCLLALISCLPKQRVCPTGPYQIPAIRITGDTLPHNAGFTARRYDIRNFTYPLDSVKFSADAQGKLDYDLEVSQQYNYIIRCDTLKIRDTVTEIFEIRDECGNYIVSMTFKLNGRLVSNPVIHY
jgi:hypothetical protein